MVKKLTLALVIILLFIGAGAHYLLSNLDSLVKEAIEKYGTEVTHTKVAVSSVKISLTSGAGAVSGLSVGNPPDFSTPEAFELGSISVKIDLNSLKDTNGPIIISEIDIEKPTVAYEVSDAGNSNLQALQHNIQNYSIPASQQESGNTQAEKGQNRKVIVRDLYIREGHLQISNKTLLQGKSFNVPLSEIHLTNIGQSSGGADPSQIAKQIFSSITTTSIRDAANGITKQLKSLNVDGVGNTVKGLLR